ncbi:nucleoside-diphosphate-sugar epimerase family protein [Stachybotrys elegans]|uniref:Nucleoside-diphosphate-sugar epimerase family protein n=1 Tax=Stachybotrys elegans TaxID=80388 RepID=A0A8K0SVP9_9HYPO|nr:nucleoside-diphosphate-sugar epimerase family protein [Stachybotrys elegans]
MTARKILVVGATGQQGRATIAALHSSHTSASPLQIIALTRSATAPRAQSLQSSYQNVELLEGDVKDPGPIFQAHPDITSVFLVTAAVAAESRVDHVVFSSVDRGGNDLSWDTPTDVPHFAAKHEIELLLRQSCEEAQREIHWTILRPTGFMDNFGPTFFGSFMATLWAQGMPADRKMQLVSTHDIGVFAAKALLDPERWAGQAVGLAGDDLSFSELQQVFERTVGKPLPTTYQVLARPALWWIAEVRTSFEWFSNCGYGVNIASLREEEPGLQTFEVWLRDSSSWGQHTAA